MLQDWEAPRVVDLARRIYRILGGCCGGAQGAPGTIVAFDAWLGDAEADTYREREIECARADSVRLTSPLCLVTSNANACFGEVARAMAVEGGHAFRSLAGTSHLLRPEMPEARAAIATDLVVNLAPAPP